MILTSIHGHHNLLSSSLNIIRLLAAFEGKIGQLSGMTGVMQPLPPMIGKDKTVVCHDRRDSASSTIDLDGADDTLFAIVLNIPVGLYAGIVMKIPFSDFSSFYALALKGLGLNKIAHSEGLNCCRFDSAAYRTFLVRAVVS
ncbi:hypothetical protein SADUNF_Sadunf09G0033600 [Salix dunnii]|uniref:Uncharacterized protein n=1 Tax=Salix dunnii TaxID=1413687 RepID=A0A835JQ92_9ROSI|nr:hypothetical protein SADUNF_Sadunf09G0033600 [Salix dunnii]